ncbi:methyl coenzyme M reductase subunit C [Rhizobium sp. SORGH_AS 787]|uniref:Methyl coenzyme M reductase subunit C n=1 Tax=Agrobacterium larrymoorei TaxID=160699 RepID=A0AAJ2ETJ3_9HYPH|nr:methyl coenzyme M reductase subunit C [Rhizobium sp. SORGH_AS_0787]MDR6100437.1 methyl coenzyme M reductase subunit C [Agrobacterium larrymoorei]
MCIEIIYTWIDTELIREIVNHCQERLLIIPQKPSRLTQYAELNCKAQLVMSPHQRPKCVFLVIDAPTRILVSLRSDYAARGGLFYYYHDRLSQR